MKDKIKGLLVGLIIGILISSSVVCASTGTFKKDIHYRNIKITLDGRQVTPKDVSGNYVEPFIIDGTTYLPVRGIANALGLDVGWEDSTSTVNLYTDGYSDVSGNQNDIIFNSNSIVVTYKGHRFNDAGRLIVSLCIENNSTQPILVQTRGQSVNGFMIEPYFSARVQPGKKINDELEFDERDLEKNYITRVEEIEFSLYICNEETWELIKKSDPITIGTNGVKSSTSYETNTSTDLALMLEFINLGVDSYNSAYNCLTYYVRTGDDSYINTFFGHISVGLESLENAYEISTRFSEFADISGYLWQCIDIFETVENGSYNVVELGDILEPANEHFKAILKELKSY